MAQRSIAWLVYAVNAPPQVDSPISLSEYLLKSFLLIVFGPKSDGNGLHTALMNVLYVGFIYIIRMVAGRSILRLFLIIDFGGEVPRNAKESGDPPQQTMG